MRGCVDASQVSLRDNFLKVQSSRKKSFEKFAIFTKSPLENLQFPQKVP